MAPPISHSKFAAPTAYEGDADFWNYIYILSDSKEIQILTLDTFNWNWK